MKNEPARTAEGALCDVLAEAVDYIANTASESFDVAQLNHAVGTFRTQTDEIERLRGVLFDIAKGHGEPWKLAAKGLRRE